MASGSISMRISVRVVKVTGLATCLVCKVTSHFERPWSDDGNELADQLAEMKCRCGGTLDADPDTLLVHMEQA